jgi:hypothetical protein
VKKLEEAIKFAKEDRQYALLELLVEARAEFNELVEQSADNYISFREPDGDGPFDQARAIARRLVDKNATAYVDPEGLVLARAVLSLLDRP